MKTFLSPLKPVNLKIIDIKMFLRMPFFGKNILKKNLISVNFFVIIKMATFSKIKNSTSRLRFKVIEYFQRLLSGLQTLLIHKRLHFTINRFYFSWILQVYLLTIIPVWKLVNLFLDIEIYIISRPTFST